MRAHLTRRDLMGADLLAMSLTAWAMLRYAQFDPWYLSAPLGLVVVLAVGLAGVKLIKAVTPEE